VPRFPATAAKADANWSALPDAWQSAYSRRRSQRGRGRALATVLVLACVIGIAGIAYAVSHRHDGAPPAATGSVPPASQAGPAYVVQEYFWAINHHRYALAWQLRGEDGPFAKFKAGFAGTFHDAVRIDSVTGDVVTAQLKATQLNGTVKFFRGTYTVVNGVISASDIVQVS
jgi:hypothetical protein